MPLECDSWIFDWRALMRTSTRTALLLLAMLAVLAGAPQIPTSYADQGVDWNQVTLIYTGDVGGKIDPCG